MQAAFQQLSLSNRFENPLNAGPLSRAGTIVRPRDFSENFGLRHRIITVERGRYLFSQGDAATAIFYLQQGEVRLMVFSRGGKEATIAWLSAGDFAGEECAMEIQPTRMNTAVAVTPCTLIRIERSELIRALHRESALSVVFIDFLLSRNAGMQEALLDQIFNCSEKRLARALLQMAHADKGGARESVVPKVSQEELAKIVGTTRSRVSYFMNRFRRLGYIDYNGSPGDGLRIRGSLRNVVLSGRGFCTDRRLLKRSRAA